MLGVAFSQTSIYEDLFYRLGPAMSFSEPSAESEALVIYNGEIKGSYDYTTYRKRILNAFLPE